MTDQPTIVPGGRYLMVARVDIGEGVIYPHDTAGMLRGAWWRERGATFIPEAYIDAALDAALDAVERTLTGEAVAQAAPAGGTHPDSTGSPGSPGSPGRGTATGRAGAA